MLIHFLPIWFGDVIDTGYGKFSRRGFFSFSYSSIIDDDEDKGAGGGGGEGRGSFIILYYHITQYYRAYNHLIPPWSLYLFAHNNKNNNKKKIKIK